MAVRIQNGSVLNFGTFGANTSVSHVRVSRGTKKILDGHALTGGAVTVDANGTCQFAVGALDLVFPKGAMEDEGLKQMLDAEFANSIKVELMTSTTALVTTSGYAAASSTDWDSSTEND